MREVKYRTWWSKTMCEVTCIDFAYNECLMKYQPQTTNDCIEKIVPLNEVKIMQWTGLKDKNGTEIYEGDIFRDNDTYLWEVFFEDGMFCAKGGEYDLVEALIEFIPEHCEIIGNIYENPELLEGDN